ncbi:MAG TPA: putative quinol monooxygenase [Acidimicrobiales bacterium]|nr:putative quinol monooxygenase [Acidimicrobiales bacterium]
MITVIANYRARSGSADEVAAALAHHVAATRRESGCLLFVASRSRDDTDSFVLLEQYVDEQAFEAHRASPHFEQYVIGTIVPLLEQRVFSFYDEVQPESE